MQNAEVGAHVWEKEEIIEKQHLYNPVLWIKHKSEKKGEMDKTTEGTL